MEPYQHESRPSLPSDKVWLPLKSSGGPEHVDILIYPPCSALRFASERLSGDNFGFELSSAQRMPGSDNAYLRHKFLSRMGAKTPSWVDAQ